MRLRIHLFLVVVTFFSYCQVLDFDFINYDDNEYVTENRHISKGFSPGGVVWAFTEIYASNWHPLTWLSHMLDFELYELDPFGHHLSSLLLHICNTLLLFGVLLKMTGAIWRSGVVALLFAVHPLNVESVAWIAERKNVLSTFFWFLTMWAYVGYVEKKNIGNYLLVFVFLSLGLMSKAMLVTLPCALILLDYWPLKRWGWSTSEHPSETNSSLIQKETLSQIVLEKVPLFLLVFGVSITTYIAQKGAMHVADPYSLYASASNALNSYLTYLGKMMWPRELSIFYPHPGDALPLWVTIINGSSLIALTILAVKGFRRYPFILVGWLWYLGTLVPVIGVVQVGEQAMADRYMYVPLVGIFIAITWGLPELIGKGKQKLLSQICGGYIIILLVFTWVQVGYWKNSVTLFERAISVTKSNSRNSYLAYYNLGHALASEKRFEEAIIHYKNSIQINPNDSKSFNNLGNAFVELKKYDDAIPKFRQAILLKEDYAQAYNNLANALADTGKLKESIIFYNEAIRFKSGYADPHFNLGITLSQLGQPKEAIIHYKKSLEINPDLFHIHNELATQLGRLGDIVGAIVHYQKAIDIEPDYAKAHHNLGSILAQQGKFEEAIAYFEKTISLDPSFIQARQSLDLARSIINENLGTQN